MITISGVIKFNKAYQNRLWEKLKKIIFTDTKTRRNVSDDGKKSHCRQPQNTLTPPGTKKMHNQTARK